MRITATSFGFACAVLLLAGSLAAQTVRINEAYSRGVAGDLDWVEIYNPTSTPKDVSDFKIYDSGGKAGSKPKKPLPAGTVIPAFGFYTVIVDTASFEGDQSGFGISSGGETVWLDDAAGVLVDSVAIPPMSVDSSWARVPDGADAWMLISPRTKSKTNVAVKMNEAYSRGTPGNLDWIELHNNTAVDIDISGYKIYDSGGKSGSKPKKEVPAGTVLAANGFTVIIVDTASFEGDQSGFGLSSGGETVWLENAAGVLIDTVAIPALGVDTSWSRIPDGSNVFFKSKLTRGATNGSVTSVELHAAPTGMALHQNYPNPFNPSTTVSFTVASRSTVSLTVSDLLGRHIATLAAGEYPPGTHRHTFDAAALPAGMYVLVLRSGTGVATRVMTLLK